MDDLPDVSAIRSELGLSQAKFAELVFVDQSTVSLWETGKKNPDRRSRALIRQVLEHHRQGAAA